MAREPQDVRREAHTKIRTRIVAALEQALGLDQTPGLQMDFGPHLDTWLSLPPAFSKGVLSDDSIVAAVQKAFGFAFAQGSVVRFSDAQQGADIWLPLPPNFLKDALSDDERQAVAGWSIMIRWDVVPGKVLREAEAGELLLIGVGIFPAKFFGATA